MPSVDLSRVTDYAAFERAYFELLETLNKALTEEHVHVYPDGSVTNWLYRTDGVPLIGPEPTETLSHYRAVRFEDDGSVVVTYPEQNEPNGWSLHFDVRGAMAFVLLAPLESVAKEFARNNPRNSSLEAQNQEIVRLLRVIDDEWADQFDELGRFPMRQA